MNVPNSNSAISAANTKIMNRSDLTRRLVAILDQHEAIVAGIGHTNFDLWAAGHRPENFYMLGSMGLACPIAFGVALAQPRRRVFALEGDGSLLMQLGALATIAKQAPKNLTIIVMDNRAYQITGSQPTATDGAANLVEIARACGLRHSAWAADEDDFESLVRQARTTDGPHLIGVRLDNKKPPAQTPRDPPQIRSRFMIGVGTKEDVWTPAGR